MGAAAEAGAAQEEVSNEAIRLRAENARLLEEARKTPVETLF